MAGLGNALARSPYAPLVHAISARWRIGAVGRRSPWLQDGPVAERCRFPKRHPSFPFRKAVAAASMVQR